MEKILQKLIDLLEKTSYSGSIVYLQWGILACIAFPLLWKWGKALYQYFVKWELEKRLPLFMPADILNATKFYIPLHYQKTAPSNEQELRDNTITRKRIIPYFLKQAFSDKHDGGNKFYAVLAGSGMGKTTFMINLYLRYIDQLFGRKYKIKLLPLRYEKLEQEIEVLLKDGKAQETILLLDAFDEAFDDDLQFQEYNTRLKTLTKKTELFNKVILTCRTQFFPDERGEPKTTGTQRFGSTKYWQEFQRLYISPFTDNDIHRYLNKKFSFWQISKKRKALQIIAQCDNLMVRPMLLNWIDELLKNEKEYTAAYMIYEDLIKWWIHLESKRKETDEEMLQYQKELEAFLRAIALNMYHCRNMRGGLYLNSEDMKSFTKTHKINLMELELKTRSLLNRNGEGEYKFSHRTILEYFLAKEAVDNISFRKEFEFKKMEQAKRFYNEFIQKKVKALFHQNNIKGSYATETYKFDDFTRITVNVLPQILNLTLENCTYLDVNVLLECIALQELTLINTDISRISELEHVTNLQKLTLLNCQFSETTTLNDLKSLEILNLDGNRIHSLDLIKNVENLRELTLANCQISKMEQLKELKKLQTLILKNCQIADMSVLKDMEQLQGLTVTGCQFSDPSILNELQGLKTLDIRGNQEIVVENLENVEIKTDLGTLEAEYVSIEEEELEGGGIRIKMEARNGKNLRLRPFGGF